MKFIKAIDTHSGTEYQNVDGISERDKSLLYGLETKNAIEREKVVLDFFSILCEEPSLALLARTDRVHGRVFYKVLKGRKSMRKRRILDHALTYYSLKRLRMEDGTPYATTTFNGKLKHLFADFHFNGIEFSRTLDFNAQGSFGKKVESFWNRPDTQREKGGKLGVVKADRPLLPDDYDEIIHRKVVDEKLVDFSGTGGTCEILWVIAFKICTQGGMRGQSVSIKCVMYLFNVFLIY